MLAGLLLNAGVPHLTPTTLLPCLAGPSLSGTGAVQDRHHQRRAWMEEAFDTVFKPGDFKRWVARVKLQTGVGNIRSVPESEIVKQIEKVSNRVHGDCDLPDCETGGLCEATGQEEEAERHLRRRGGRVRGGGVVLFVGIGGGFSGVFVVLVVVVLILCWSSSSCTRSQPRAGESGGAGQGARDAAEAADGGISLPLLRGFILDGPRRRGQTQRPQARLSPLPRRRLRSGVMVLTTCPSTFFLDGYLQKSENSFLARLPLLRSKLRFSIFFQKRPKPAFLLSELHIYIYMIMIDDSRDRDMIYIICIYTV